MMRVYGWVWQVVWAIVVLASVAAAWLAWPHGGAPVMFVTSAALIGAMTLVHQQTKTPFGRPSREVAARCVLVGLLGAACTVAFLFLAVTAAPLGWPLAALAAATSPWTLRRALREVRDRRRRARVAAWTGPGESAWWAVLREETRLLSDPELCRAWRASFQALLDAGDAAAREQVVRIRELYLDELTSRHPEAVTAWLASNPRATSGPERFLHDAA
jgi:hypothetical protein